MTVDFLYFVRKDNFKVLHTSCANIFRNIKIDFIDSFQLSMYSVSILMYLSISSCFYSVEPEILLMFAFKIHLFFFFVIFFFLLRYVTYKREALLVEVYTDRSGEFL